MGNAQSLTRTSGALDLFVAELGGDIVYEGRCVCIIFVASCFTHRSVQLGLCAFLEDREMPSQTWLPRREDIHQAGPGHELAQVP